MKEYAAAALTAVKPDGLLWISYPKKSSKVPTDLTRDEGWAVITEAGYRAVRMVSIDRTWSAVRFRQQEEKKEEDVIDAQYQGAKVGLRPLYDLLMEIVQSFGDDVELAPRKSYVAFSRGKIFALVKASTKTRLDLGLKLPNTPATGRLVDAPGFGSGAIIHKVALFALEEIDEQIGSWLHEAYKLAS